jgi:outer membrane murein-binding lipoprotein Lpp
MNLWEMVVLIVALTGLTTLGKAYIDGRGKRSAPQDDAENDRLRAQVKQLNSRIHTLERIVTDRGVQTAAQIEALREQESTEAREQG